MHIALITEGTYPFHGGGVSVWCDQLIRGMPEHRFHVIAVTGNNSEKSIWPSPQNLAQVTRVPVWGAAPSLKRASQQASKRFKEAHQDFVQTLVYPDKATAIQQFLESLKAMFAYAREANLSAALLSNAALTQLSEAWHEASKRTTNARSRNIAITFADALTATDTIEHFLRPLSFTPPKADLFHAASNGLSGLIGLTGKWAYNTPFILTEHGIYLRERYLSYLRGPGTYPVKTLLLNFFRLLAAAIYQAADLIKPGSNYNQRWELRNGAAPGRISTIYNGIDINHFPLSQQEPDLPTLSWLGRIDPLKDLHTLIYAFASVREKLPTARLRMFGAVPTGNEAYFESCQELIGRLGLEGAAQFEGRVARSVDAYHAGHVVVLSSISEGFPYSVIEAMASGKATVSTHVGGVAEAVGDAGLIVAPRDYQTMSAACLQLLLEPEQRQALGRKARSRISELFTLEQCLDAYRVTYNELAAHLPLVRQQHSRVRQLLSAKWQTA